MSDIKKYLASYNDSEEENEDNDGAADDVHDDIDISDDDQDDLARFQNEKKRKLDSPSLKIVTHEESAKVVKKITATRLVSYGEDDDNEKSLNRSSFSEQEEEEQNEPDTTITTSGNEPSETSSLAGPLHTDSPFLSTIGSPESNLNRKPYFAKLIPLPPEPPGNCSKQLQNKVLDLYTKLKKEKTNLNTSIQRKKNFRNPSIYERLIEFCGIDEKGTNYPPELYNPSIWGPESFYEELAKTQKIEMDRKEKEKKDKKFVVEKVQGTKKTNTKWDDVNAPSIQIPAVGPLTKLKPA
ncbi:hypothetical protein HELRODRAFT_165525 [Helobdella robusta]|uniref:SAP30-binding protein n=1 Tax=Helobdella robusta TaxID=6412 RepID=T1EWY9_HELRO|nr:hypothetical protein HELRODRAFT_165525 [Helobdella robusta]ESN91486.1 hypothetical protein HELRODRAFT_165525 [Helobdella robusta]